MQIVSEQRDGSTKRGKEESFWQERPVEDLWGEMCASKTHTQMYVKGGSGASCFPNIDSTLIKLSQVV